MIDESEAARDPNISTITPNFARFDVEDHRACTVYIGYYVPGYRRKSHHKRHKYHTPRSGYSSGSNYSHDVSRPVTPPSERVHFILGEEEGGSHEPHPLFSEMEELYQKGEEMEWRETARWIKFEEDVEEGGNRWSKPHVATVSLHSLFELRGCISNGSILLDLNAHGLEEIMDFVLDNMELSHQIPSGARSQIKEVLLRPHRHQHQLRDEWMDKSSRLPIIRSLTDVGRTSTKIHTHRNSASAGVLSDTIGQNQASLRSLSQTKNGSPDEASSENLPKINQSFMRKIPPKAEASNILVGEVEYLDKVISSFVRLNESSYLGDLTEVLVPTRFLFILLGPVGNAHKFHEIGRAMATLLSDEVFHGVAYKAKDRSDLLAGVDEFMGATTVLPPGVWDPSTRIEPPMQTMSQDSRKPPEPKKEFTVETASVQSENEVQDFNYGGRLFAGLIADIRRKAPWYSSDFKDCLALQCISSIVFLYFACIAQIITLGGLLAHITKNRMAAVECLFSALLCGTSYSLFGGQPLTLLGMTGPVLAFEGILFDICERYAIDYLSMRVWIGIWTSVYLFGFVAFNLASLVRNITRFTQEIFATLVSTYFIYKAFKNILQIGKTFPLRTGDSPYNPLCVCISSLPSNFTVGSEEVCQAMGGLSAPIDCSYTPPLYVPNVFLMSIILFISTFALIQMLRKLKGTPFFPSKVRAFISDFSVLIAVVLMTILASVCGIPTPKLEVPEAFKPTWTQRDWLIPLFGTNPWWLVIAAMLPAMLLTILIFMDQEITAVIVNRKENKLKKGYGYHLDLLVLSMLIGLCSILGLPWFVAATVLSITHVNSLKKASLCCTPGDKPQFLGVREQRVTHLAVYILIGISVFFTSVLQFIPMPILYGVFLFMGVKSLKGLQFIERIFLMFMPEKYQPDYGYLRYVPIGQVRLYTLLQFFLCCLLFTCKLFRPLAFVFPLLLLAVILARKGLWYCFDKTYLKMLDDVMPEQSESKKDDAHEQVPAALSEVIPIPDTNSSSTIKKNSNSHASINISEVLMQSSIWKCIDQQSQKTTKKIMSVRRKKKHRGKRESKADDCKKLSAMEEEDDDYVNSANSPISPQFISPSSSDNANGTMV